MGGILLRLENPRNRRQARREPQPGWTTWRRFV